MNAPEIGTGPVEFLLSICFISFPTAFSLFSSIFSSHSSSPIFLCPSSTLCLASDSFFQVELIESFPEIPTFSKKPNKCLLRGKARLEFQRKSYPGRRCRNGLQDCTAPFNPWLTWSWVMLWVFIPAGAWKKEPLCILAMNTKQPTRCWCSIPQMSGGLQPLELLCALATTQPTIYGNPKSFWLYFIWAEIKALVKKFVLRFKAVKRRQKKPKIA